MCEIQYYNSDKGKEILREIVAMLIGLIRSQNVDRVHEDAIAYNFEE